MKHVIFQGKLLDVISRGASMGIEECQFQFQNRRWNCSTFNNTDVFGNLVKTSKCLTYFAKRVKLSLVSLYLLGAHENRPIETNLLSTNRIWFASEIRANNALSLPFVSPSLGFLYCHIYF